MPFGVRPASAGRSWRDPACCPERAIHLFEPTHALPCVDGPVTTPVESPLVPEHPRGHGALYGALNRGRIDANRLRACWLTWRCPASTGRLVLAVDVSPWLRWDTPCSAARLVAAPKPTVAPDQGSFPARRRSRCPHPPSRSPHCARSPATLSPWP
ncbi:transposase [Streptomyces sp. MMG1121]|uniref:transposase n=1 Tax=Streptomyces sp. MMG1121 TaxID=1415544 RepID=UPI003B640EAF